MAHEVGFDDLQEEEDVELLGSHAEDLSAEGLEEHYKQHCHEEEEPLIVETEMKKLTTKNLKNSYGT